MGNDSRVREYTMNDAGVSDILIYFLPGFYVAVPGYHVAVIDRLVFQKYVKELLHSFTRTRFVEPLG
jgi:hypothetical protein